MKTIKLRAWNKQKRHMYTWANLLNHETFDVLVNDGWHVMQFTGLLDKNKKEIYDGDIVRHCHNTTPFDDTTRTCKKETVKWNEQYASWYRGIAPAYGYVGDLEVIGNIYEKNHLLTDAKQEKSEQGT